MTIPFTKSLRGNRGFTLVELLVVIAIIGILATLLLLQLNQARAKGRDAKRVSDVGQLRTAVELFYNDNGYVYPAAPLGNQLDRYLTTGNLPADPQGVAYGYATNTVATPSLFQLHTELETNNSSAFATDSDINSTAAGLNWLGGVTVDGTVEGAANCTSAANDCVFDVGVTQ